MRNLIALLALFIAFQGKTFASDTAPAPAAATEPSAPAADAKDPADHSEAPAQAKAAAKKTLRVNCLADEVALDDLRKRQTDLEARDKDLVRREDELRAKETALAAEIKTLRDLKNEIRELEQLQSAKQQESVARMVEMVENMSPKAAAQVLSKVSDPIAIAAMKQLPAPKLAKIMNSIEPTKASRLSELLATDGFASARAPASSNGEKK